MKTIITYCTVLFLSLSLTTYAQEETRAEKIQRLEQQKKEIITEEKQALKEKVELINQQLESKKIDWEQAGKLKEVAAKEHALNIKNRIAIIENEFALTSRGREGEQSNTDGIKEDKELSTTGTNTASGKEKKYDRRTYTDLVIAAGFNNAIQEGGSLNDTDFKIGGSRFFELGIAWKTRVFRNSNWLRFKYGISFQFNGLKPTDNRYYVEDGGLTRLEAHSQELDKSKFRMDNLVVPLHFEIGPSSRMETGNRLRFSTRSKLKIGMGGYAGFNIGERQKLKYEDQGEDVKQKLKGDYNTNELVYGLSAYLGWGGTAAYVKYGLNAIFDDPNPELRNVSIGLRFDVD